MTHTRKKFLQLAMLASGGAASGFRSPAPVAMPLPVKNGPGSVPPISATERMSRVRKAQSLMKENKLQALVIDAGTALRYFTGVYWGESERPMLAVIPADGDVRYVCPAFEEDRLREQLTIGKEVFAWEEDENPYSQVIKAITGAGNTAGQVGLEEQLRFFIFDGLRKAGPAFSFVSGDAVSIPCRMIKSAAEIALMQAANDATEAAIRAGIAGLQEGMTPGDVEKIIAAGHTAHGGRHDFALVLFGTASALPHGSRKPQRLAKGDIVLMDCGCLVEGYNSDITRTVVFGAAPTARQQQVWTVEQRAQAAGFQAARPGSPCEAVDAAARGVITAAGFGPGYKLPGLPHRTGHGIGLDGHEWGNMVNGNKQLLVPGMCFSIEPTIAIPGEFGVRLEDCAYITEQGPKWFSPPATAIDKPFG